MRIKIASNYSIASNTGTEAIDCCCIEFRKGGGIVEQFALFLGFKSIIQELGLSFGSITFNDMNSNKSNVAGVFIRGDAPSEYRDVATGEYYNLAARVQFLMNGSIEKSGLMKLLSDASKLRHKLVKLGSSWRQIDGDLAFENGALIYKENSFGDDTLGDGEVGASVGNEGVGEVGEDAVEGGIGVSGNAESGNLENLEIPNANASNVWLFISSVRLIGEVHFEGKNSQGLPRYSLNVKVYYSVVERNGKGGNV